MPAAGETARALLPAKVTPRNTGAAAALLSTATAPPLPALLLKNVESVTVTLIASVAPRT